MFQLSLFLIPISLIVPAGRQEWLKVVRAFTASSIRQTSRSVKNFFIYSEGKKAAFSISK